VRGGVAARVGEPVGDERLPAGANLQRSAGVGDVGRKTLGAGARGQAGEPFEPMLVARSEAEDARAVRVHTGKAGVAAVPRDGRQLAVASRPYAERRTCVAIADEDRGVRIRRRQERGGGVRVMMLKMHRRGAGKRGQPLLGGTHGLDVGARGVREAKHRVHGLLRQRARFDPGAAHSRDALLLAERLEASVHTHRGSRVLRGGADAERDRGRRRAAQRLAVAPGLASPLGQTDRWYAGICG
jgi:hypothetical protein